jgi:hypothetical protein
MSLVIVKLCSVNRWAKLTEKTSLNMGRRKPDFLWVLVLVVTLGAVSSTLMGDESPRMAPQQAGIIVR